MFVPYTEVLKTVFVVPKCVAWYMHITLLPDLNTLMHM